MIIALFTETPDRYKTLARTLADVLQRATATTVHEILAITTKTITNYQHPQQHPDRTTTRPHTNQAGVCTGAEALRTANALHGRTVLPSRTDYIAAITLQPGHHLTQQQLTDAHTDTTRQLATDPDAVTHRAAQGTACGNLDDVGAQVAEQHRCVGAARTRLKSATTIPDRAPTGGRCWVSSWLT